MRTRDLPVSRTQRRVGYPTTTCDERDGYALFDSPRFRLSWFGHRLELDHPTHDLAPWWDRWHAHHAGLGVHRCYVVWEVPGSAPRPIDLPVNVDIAVVDGLIRSASSPVPDTPCELPVRLATHAELDKLVHAATAVHDTGDPDMVEYLHRSGSARAEQCQQGLARWFAAFDGDVPVASATLFSWPGEARFQDVWTHPAWRKKGLATAVVAEALRDHRRRTTQGQVIIAADRDAPAGRIYRQLGFVQCSTAVELSKRPAPTGS